MDQFLDKHRGHNAQWAQLTSSDFPWTVGGERKQSQQAERRAMALRLQADLGPLWKRAREGYGSLLMLLCIAAAEFRHSANIPILQ